MDDYSSWLEAIGQMVPNTHAVVMTFVDGREGGEGNNYWPQKGDEPEELYTFLAFAISQQSHSTSVVSGDKYRIALPVLSRSKEAICYLAVEVVMAGRTPESIQGVVEWSGLWLGLLLQQEMDNFQSSISNGKGLTNSEPTGELLDEASVKPSIAPSAQGYLSRFKYLFVLACLALILAIPVDYRISVNAVVEGEIESPVIAPFDGYIKSSDFKAGDPVEVQTIVAELDERDIALNLQKLEGERQEKERSYRQVLASGERAKAEVLKAKIIQLTAQIETAQLTLNQTELRSRISGIVIAGDLGRSIGAPVKKGDVLFKIAPADRYRVMLRIKETDIRFMARGLRADLKLTSQPSQTYVIKLLKPSPFFTEENNEIVYLTEAEFEEGGLSVLRPGMEGVAKVNVGSYSLAWGLFHHFSDWLRIQFWAIKP